MRTHSQILVLLVLSLGAPNAYAEHGRSHVAHEPAPQFGSPDGTLKDGVRSFAVSIAEDGFQPAKLRAYSGELLRLEVRRQPASKCTGELKVEGLGIVRALPGNASATVEFKAEHAGTIRIHCGGEAVLKVFVRRPPTEKR